MNLFLIRTHKFIRLTHYCINGLESVDKVLVKHIENDDVTSRSGLVTDFDVSLWKSIVPLWVLALFSSGEMIYMVLSSSTHYIHEPMHVGRISPQ